ncbi:MAG: hypothetical protein A2234_10525 [Elusimicrobia bacterium RIFOXYA2_FULL_58_8]|nr:MAG: hypothetical protein A2234_10525 [Elusimicrobia bacterium RIFOXYA2_FULL_58_8]
MKEGNITREFSGLLGRLIVGGIFLYSGVVKAAAPVEEFAKAIESYRVVGAFPALLAAYIVPWVEIFAGALLAAGIFTRYSGLFTAAMLLFFEALLGQAWLRGLPIIYCGCFGAQGRNSVGREFLQNLVLLGLLWLGIRLGRRFSADAVIGRHSGYAVPAAFVLAVCAPALTLPFLAGRYGGRSAEVPAAAAPKQGSAAVPVLPRKTAGGGGKKTVAAPAPESGGRAAEAPPTRTIEVNPGFDAGRDSVRDIKTALTLARKQRKRVMVIVGGYWCEWCTKMSRLFREDSVLAEKLGRNFVVVKVYYDFSTPALPEGIAGYPKMAGVPQIYILDTDGTILESKDTVHLEAGTGYDREKITAFLDKWAVGS